MVGGVFVGEESELLERVEDQAVVSEADVVAVAFFEDAHFDAVGLAVGEAVLDHVARQFFHAQGEVVSAGAVAAVFVAELPHCVGQVHHFVHTGDRYIEFVLLEHVEGVREQEDPVPQAFPVDIDPAALDSHHDAVIAHHEKLGNGVGQPDGVGSVGRHHSRSGEDQKAGLTDESRNGCQPAFSNSLEVVEIDQIEAVDGHSDGVAARK